MKISQSVEQDTWWRESYVAAVRTLLCTSSVGNKCSFGYIYLDLFSSSINLLNPNRAFVCPSANPTAFDKLTASSYLCFASLSLPSISKNSPRLCVATAHPTSHSWSRSGGFIVAACAIALVAHCRACSIRSVRGAEFVTGKSVGSSESVMASAEGFC